MRSFPQSLACRFHTPTGMRNTPPRGGTRPTNTVRLSRGPRAPHAASWDVKYPGWRFPVCDGTCDGLLRVLLRVKCLIINKCYGVTGVSGGMGMLPPALAHPTHLLGEPASATLICLPVLESSQSGAQGTERPTLIRPAGISGANANHPYPAHHPNLNPAVLPFWKSDAFLTVADGSVDGSDLKKVLN